MCPRHWAIRVMVAAAVGLAGVGVGATWGPAVQIARAQDMAPASGAPPDRAGLSVRHFSADLTIRHQRVGASGLPVGVRGPDLVMRVVREVHEGRWRTTLAVDRQPDLLIDAPGGATRLRNPFSIARIEFRDGDESPRVVGHDGRLTRVVTADDLRLVGAAQTLRAQSRPDGSQAAPGTVGFLAEVARHAERRDELVRRFGAPTGLVRGLDRYVDQDALGRREVLVVRDTALPVEITAWATGGAQMRTAITYEQHGAVGHVRRLMRTEHQSGDTRAGRTITEVALANVVIADQVQP
jgi:hypothetical protein